MNSQTSENHFHLKTTRQPIKRVPPPGACPACQGFLENISHSSTDEGHSAATPDLWGDCRLSPTAHKLKCQLSGFLSQDNKDLPTVSNFPAFFEQIFQMNHLIKHKARLYANILYGIIKHILRKKLTYALETKNLQNIAYPPLDCLYKYMRALKDQLAFLIIQHIVPNTYSIYCMGEANIGKLQIATSLMTESAATRTFKRLSHVLRGMLKSIFFLSQIYNIGI